ncbi:MAG: hypothetical protein AABZ47_01095 [Planctomycetota bacterium]
MSGIDPIVLVLRWIHLASAIVAIGGAAFSLFVLIPGVKKTLDESTHQRLREAVRARWAPIVHPCIALLLLTGFINFFLLVIFPKVPAIPYHAVFGPKLLLALFIFFVAEALVGRAPGFAKMREAREKWLKILLVAAAVVVLLSGVLNQIRSQHLKQGASAPSVTKS